VFFVNIISFVQQYEMLTFTNALRTLDKAEEHMGSRVCRSLWQLRMARIVLFYVNFILRKMSFNNFFLKHKSSNEFFIFAHPKILSKRCHCKTLK
jgi:hypothetical protein